MEEGVEAAVGPDDGYLLVRIHVPELNVHKCLQFPKDQLVWDVKQQCLAALPKVASWYRELKESFNYGLFCPPVNGKAGKFLDEERRLGDYPFNGPVGYLELKAKRRVYKMVNLDEKQLKALHTRTNLRRFLDYVTNAQVEKINKMCSKGLDPNFHCPDTGETPLTLATGVRKPTNVLKALVNGGALLDYRTRDGSTAVHRAVEHNSLEAVGTLLELGASPNYRDCKGLTPLYLAVTHGAEPLLCEALLHNRAVIGAQDLQGWQEVHQACRNGLVQHLEHLLYYGADMNARNASGNTPLHVCAVNGQESCARVLLFRGCQHDALNYANQTPYQVAVIAGNLDLADVIQAHRPENVVPFRELPRYNPRRRSMLPYVPAAPMPPPSPSPSARSFPPFSSASSSLSETSSGSTKTTTTEDTASYVTDKSLCDTSDIISDSSGVGTANSDSITLPGTSVVCVENYSSSQPGHLRLCQGDILEVTGATDCGLLEGSHRGGGEAGLFPAHCVQEVRLRQGLVPPPPLPVHRRVVGRRESNATTLKHFATAPRHKKQLPAEPRTVVLHRARRGFGFVLRGAKATSPLMELQPSARCPALQYLDDVDKGGVADMAGLRKGDYLVAINGEDVSAASHEHVVDVIRKSGDLVSLTVVSLGALPSSKSAAAGLTAPETQPTPRQYATLPRKLNTNFPTLGRSPAPLPPRRDPKTTLSVGRARAKSMVAEEEGAGSGDSMDHGKVQPRTASIRARPTSSRITAAELESLFQRQTPYMMTTSNFQCSQGNSQPSSPARTPRVYASVAEMKRSKGKSNARVRFSLAGIGMAGMTELHRDFHSTPDLATAVSGGVGGTRQHRSQEELRPLPPPTHPPPPPPAPTTLVKVDVKDPEYGNVSSTTTADTNGGDGVMSSFKPAASAKLYASPEDVKNVGYRSRSLPAHSSRPQVRKSQSLRSPSSSFKPVTPSNGAQSGGNPYAQPIRNRKQQTLSAPPIPDPDYSLSENESDTEPAGEKTVIRVSQTEGSGGSSTSSGSLPHSFSVDEIQKVRTQLKSSKSYPNDFLMQGGEDGDNSSSGVSSDQEIPAAPEMSAEAPVPSGNATLPRTSQQRTTLTRNAVSLAQLPPPLEADTDEREELVVPPPPEYAGGGAGGPVVEEVLAPPPQFSDGRLVTRVRIVGTVPKSTPSRLHSQ
ncbi:SH3 and multiple ankyrin repeat domains protein 3 isoform X3 [Homalodisca vitripennis]|uniref:SH3 and multiple ankyrin repeat domains protein 3 isoform X3 n=1 Tax=Homalodisca vitripennis TaxID=197043 RepID=UPI001EEAC902|nr:SH3 and multiple ankyrin repeat domains protein 3 isoform X3 [Homalodisca vitripennis]